MRLFLLGNALGRVLSHPSGKVVVSNPMRYKCTKINWCMGAFFDKISNKVLQQVCVGVRQHAKEGLRHTTLAALWCEIAYKRLFLG
jgi:hypothetical protein